MKKKPLIDDEVIFDLLENRARPRKARARGTFENVAATGKRAVLALYDEISWWTGNDARTFRDTLKALDAEVIELRINSPGGGVFEGVAIYNMLVSHPARVEVHVDGIAASIASVIAMAGDERYIAENAQMMIHNPSVGIRGTSDDLRKFADVLDKIKESILNTYEGLTALTREELSAAMDAETYYTADEAVTAGFATSKTAAMKAAACALWEPGEFPDLPENVRALGKCQADEPEPETDPEPEPDPEPELRGTVEDVENARAFALRIAAAHGL